MLFLVGLIARGRFAELRGFQVTGSLVLAGLAVVSLAGCGIQSVQPPYDQGLAAGVVSDARPIPDASPLVEAAAALLGAPDPTGTMTSDGALREIVVALDDGGAMSVVSSDSVAPGAHVRILTTPTPRVIASP